MNTLEEYYEIYQTRSDHRKNLKQIMKCRCDIIDQNLIAQDTALTKEEHPSNTSRVLLSTFQNNSLEIWQVKIIP